MKKVQLIVLIFLVFWGCKKDYKNAFRLEIPAFTNGGMMPAEYAFCIPDETGKVELGQNRNPHIRWFNVPAEAKSLVLLCVDPDVPVSPIGVNIEGETVPVDRPRKEFYHWVLVDIPVVLGEIQAGIDSDSITVAGKDPGKKMYGTRGINDYTRWFKGDMTMGGTYAGYDGPCPPWNDLKIHRYFFKLYALDIATLGLGRSFSAKEVMEAMEDHILDQAEWIGLYSINQKVLATIQKKLDQRHRCIL